MFVAVYVSYSLLLWRRLNLAETNLHWDVLKHCDTFLLYTVDCTLKAKWLGGLTLCPCCSESVPLGQEIVGGCLVAFFLSHSFSTCKTSLGILPGHAIGKVQRGNRKVLAGE